jgi:hypothetical protein
VPGSFLAASLLLVAPARAVPPAVHATAPRLHQDLSISWSNLNFSPGGTEEAAVGPDVLAVGEDGRWALWDPVAGVVRGSEGEFERSMLSSMAFAEDGALLVLDSRARTLGRYDAGKATGTWDIDRMSPMGVSLVVSGGRAWGRDPYGGLHALATLDGDGDGDAPVARRSRLNGGRVIVDGKEFPAPADVLAARILGDWVIIEAGRPGALRERYAQSLGSGRRVTLPLLRDQRYRPIHDLVAVSDGSLAWIDARSDALHLHRVWP